jgi:hypothetical protein
VSFGSQSHPLSNNKQKVKVSVKPSKKNTRPALTQKKNATQTKKNLPSTVRTHEISTNTKNNVRGASSRAVQIPRSSTAKPLHTKGGSRPGIDRKLKKKAVWYNAVMDPAQGAGVKIPDDVAVETGTLQCVYETGFTVGALGLGGIRTVSLHPNSAGGTGYNIQDLQNISGPTTLAWNTATGLPTNAALQSYSTHSRVVSAGLYVESEASLSNASGEMVVGYEPYGYNSTPLLSDFKNLYGSSIMPLNVSKPMLARWTPISYDQQTYTSFFDNNYGNIGDLDGRAPEWCLFCIVNGAPANVVFRVRLVVNYEFIPFLNSIDIVSANPSPVDETEINLTESWLAVESAVSPTTTEQMSRSPGAGVKEKIGEQDGGPTGFGMFFDVLTELAPLALEMLI